MRNTLASSLLLFALIAFFVINSTVSCAVKKPILYKDGRHLTIMEYEKIAQKEYEEERYENAIDAYQAIIDNYPDNTKALAWAYYEIGYCYYAQKDYEKAERYFRRVANEFQEPAAKKLAEEMLDRLLENK